MATVNVAFGSYPLIARIKSLLRRIRRMFGLPEDMRSDGELYPAGETRQAEDKPKRNRKHANVEIGEFHLKTTVLDLLDDYFYYLQRMKKGDRDAYELYKRIGAHIVPGFWNYFDAGEKLVVPPYWRETMPSFGCVALAVGSGVREQEIRTNLISPRFIYFRKYCPTGVPSGIQRSNGTTYVMTIYWDERRDYDGSKPILKRKRGVQAEVPLSIMPDGTVRVLLTRMREVRNPSGRRDGSFPVIRWGINDFFKEWAREGQKGNCANFLIGLFLMAAASHQASANAMTRISVVKDKMTAVFSVPIERTPYFFSDRGVTLAATGSKRRVFHIVKAHKRVLAGGAERWIRTHFRGEREFMWNGYAVSISVPGWHHASIATMNVGYYDAEFAPAGEDVVGSSGVGDILNDVILQSTGGEYGRRIALSPAPSVSTAGTVQTRSPRRPTPSTGEGV